MAGIKTETYQRDKLSHKSGHKETYHLHIACALEWQAELFASADKRQLTAAKRAGLKTRAV